MYKPIINAGSENERKKKKKKKKSLHNTRDTYAWEIEMRGRNDTQLVVVAWDVKTSLRDHRFFPMDIFGPRKSEEPNVSLPRFSLPYSRLGGEKDKKIKKENRRERERERNNTEQEEISMECLYIYI